MYEILEYRSYEFLGSL